MEWVTIITTKHKKRRHVNHTDWYSLCGADLYSYDQVKDDPTAPKCKNCLRVLQRLIEK